jgi:hypothetical protein
VCTHKKKKKRIEKEEKKRIEKNKKRERSKAMQEGCDEG